MEPMRLNAHRQPTAMTMSQQVWTFEHYAYLFPNDDRGSFVRCSMVLKALSNGNQRAHTPMIIHPCSLPLVGAC